MNSTYVKKLRLRQDLQDLRSEHHLTQEQLAKKAGVSRGDIQLLENGRSTDQSVVLDILECLDVSEERWTQIVNTARAASEDGWWESDKNIGERQALCANLEAGASVIRTYEQNYAPGLLQVPEYVRALTDTFNLEPVPGTVNGILGGRARRQRMLRRPGGPLFEVVIDEVAIRRLSAPPDVTRKQLAHMADISAADKRIALRILPINARIRDFTVPRSGFTLYTYPDAGDPRVAAVDTVTEDVILTAADQVAAYEKLYEVLAEASLSPAESAELLAEAAAELED